MTAQRVSDEEARDYVESTSFLRTDNERHLAADLLDLRQALSATQEELHEADMARRDARKLLAARDAEIVRLREALKVARDAQTQAALDGIRDALEEAD